MSAEANKDVVRRFNREVIGGGNRAAFEALMAADFIDRTAPPGLPTGPEGMWTVFQDLLRPALSPIAVEIHEQIAEGDKVTTRKTISGLHSGNLMGIEATGRSVSIEVIDIVRVENGRYAEHWGINTLPALLEQLKQG